MKITLIKPNIGRQEHSLYVDEGRMEPLQLGVLAGFTPEDIEVQLHDDRMEQIPYDEKTDLVAITVETFTARRAYEISAEYRKRGVKVIMGGFHPTLLPDEALQNADSIFLGDAENIWHEVLSDQRYGKLKQIYRSAPGVGQQIGSKFFLPRRDIFKNKGYLPVSLMQFSRGCHLGCSYCAISVFFDKKNHTRPISEIVREIEE